MSRSAAPPRSALLLTLLLGACGYDAPLGPPSPPPQPSTLLDQKAPGVVQRTGLLSDLSVATRSWVLTADGQRLTCHLAAAGTVSVQGRTAGLEELPTDVPVTIEGVQRADLVVVDRVTVGVEAGSPTEAAPTATPTDAAPAPSPAPAGPAAPSPAAATPAGTAAPAAGTSAASAAAPR